MCFITYSSQLDTSQTIYNIQYIHTLLYTKYIQVYKETLQQSPILPDYYLSKRIKYIRVYLLAASHIRKCTAHLKKKQGLYVTSIIKSKIIWLLQVLLFNSLE